MDAARLKEHLIEHDMVPIVLESLGCHHIKHRGNYYTCANPDGDNVSAITVYLNEHITCLNHTRNMSAAPQATDLFTLVEYIKACSFFEAIKFVCEAIGLDYYHDFDEDMPESMRITQLILDMQSNAEADPDQRTLKPIPEQILSYYLPVCNDLFAQDGIDFETQRLFEVGYDDCTNRITIPIRDELGNLVGVKGRLLSVDEDTLEDKYIYLEPCAKSSVLYGLHRTYPYIQRRRKCLVGESEKSVMQLWSMGIHHSTAIGGKSFSKQQINMLSRLCVDLLFVFDKDVSLEELRQLANNFVEGTPIYALVDKEGVLLPKQSPTDDPDIFRTLLKSSVIRIR